MILTQSQRSLIERVINVAETGKPQGNYAAISLYNDGPHDIKQVTYGRSQTTEYGNLRQLVRMYIAAEGAFADALKPYVNRIGAEPLCDDRAFLDILRDAGKSDPVMARVQDEFFAKVYFDPAMAWATTNGFVLPLSALVIYDSYIHSGQMLWTIRSRFKESPPASGGSEKKWITAYAKARQVWLLESSRDVVRKSVYRVECYLEQIGAENWNLKNQPVLMNGTKVFSE